MFDISRLCFSICPIKCLRRWRWAGQNPNTTLVFCPLRVIPVIVITIAIVIIIVTIVVNVIVIYIVNNISTAVLFSLRVGILHWFLSGTWRINGSQGPIHPTPGTALEELRTRPTMHRKHLMECSTGSSRWKTNEWRHYTKLADNIPLQLLPSVVPPSPIYGICRECQEILTYALRGNRSGWS